MLDRTTATINAAWTPELVEQLKQLRAAGLSASQIADRLGMTRNAIVGACRRRGIPPSGERTNAHKGPRVKWTNHMVARLREAWHQRIPSFQIAEELGCTTLAVQQAARRYGCGRRYVRDTRPKYIATDRKDSDIPLEQRVSLLELGDKTCRWPVGDPATDSFFFCGAEPIKGRPYCSGHCARAYGGAR